MDFEKNLILMEKSKLRDEAEKGDLPIPRIYKNSICEMQDQGLNLVTSMFTFSNVKSGLYHARNKAVGAKKTVFRYFKEVEVPEIHLKNFLCEFNEGGQRMLIFCSSESQTLLEETREFFIDGTFQSCPRPFYQLLTIHGDFGSTEKTVHTKPLIYVLMPDKKQQTYIALFELLKIKLPNLKIDRLHCDFEIALCNAVTETFPTVSVKGCFYHWTRNMWRKAKQLGHKSKHERRIVGLCAILPLLSEEWILDGWNYIRTEYKESGLEMSRFMTYVSHLLKKRNHLKIISVFGLRHRTNNILEAFHSKLNKVLTKNVTLLRLLNFLTKNEKFHALQPPSKRNKKYANQDASIRNIMLQFMNGHITLGHAMEKLR